MSGPARARLSLIEALLAFAVLALALVSGCTQPAARPFAWGKKKTNEPVGIRTVAQQLEELQAIEKQAASLSADEQARTLADLRERLASEADSIVRIQIVRTAAAIPAPTAAEVLNLALEDAQADVRIAACQSWGKRGGADAVSQLSRMLGSDTDIDVRMAATRALGETKDKGAISALGEALSDTDPALQFRAMQSMRSVSGREFGNDVGARREYAKNAAAAPAPGLAERWKSLWY